MGQLRLENLFFPENFPFNPALCITQHHLLTETYGNGHGLSNAWLYLKTLLTGTLFHFEAYALGSVNCFGGKGSALWYASDTEDYQIIMDLYEGELFPLPLIYQNFLKLYQ